MSQIKPVTRSQLEGRIQELEKTNRRLSGATSKPTPAAKPAVNILTTRAALQERIERLEQELDAARSKTTGQKEQVAAASIGAAAKPDKPQLSASQVKQIAWWKSHNPATFSKVCTKLNIDPESEQFTLPTVIKSHAIKAAERNQ